MIFDFKKEYKELYRPQNSPEIISVPAMKFLAVQGAGDPNEREGNYSKALAALYAVAYTLKMSCKGAYRIEGFFEYVVPPLEGFWWQEGVQGVDLENKASFSWISVLRVPDFISQKDVDWAVAAASAKKKTDFSEVKYWELEEGLCVQMTHVGPFDTERDSLDLMERFLLEEGYAEDFAPGRMHHEIYLSDIRKVSPVKWKTVLRHPVRPK
ncbi:GyrI-like domain-containing protein [Proteiniclasticum ruminis]|uniref:GyrI-like small molecule binding domain-containing protein n=1 Tax=Proteiniclasticum ruminis TaxID=398199 RepID=A0A1I5F0U4_9CLOT|nr:GyrI-like domain-containing protein [Proteiniclasticum ruminis]SFO16951.1 hypothetical protein SAMN04488695_1249 [Proteiniclasticum ruminis]